MNRLLAAMLLTACAALPAAAQQRAAAPTMSNPSPQTVAEGKAAYDKNCVSCHGANGTAGERAPAIVLTGMTTALRSQLSESQIRGIIHDGIPDTQMPAWGGKLSDDDIGKIVAYIHALRGPALDSPWPGDPARGEQVFWGKGECGTCHMIYGRGGVVGPDLSNIAAIRKAAAISDALTKVEHKVYGDGGVAPSVIPPIDRNPVTVVTKAGQTIDGVMLNQDSYSVQMMGMDGKLHLLDRNDLTSVTIKPGTVMPTDYDKRLTKDEFGDLLAFLTRQGKMPATPTSRRGAD